MKLSPSTSKEANQENELLSISLSVNLTFDFRKS